MKRTFTKYQGVIINLLSLTMLLLLCVYFLLAPRWWSFASLGQMQEYYPRYGTLIFLYARYGAYIQLILLLLTGLPFYYLFKTKLYSVLNRLNAVFNLNYIYLLSYAVLFALALFLRFSNPLYTILDADSLGYTFPALNFLVNKEFIHFRARSYPYPLFILSVLKAFGNMNAVCLVQHSLALMTMLSAIFFVKRKIDNESGNLKKQLVIFMLSIFFLALSFLNSNIIIFERTLRPEGLILPCTFFYVFLVYAYILRIKQNKSIITTYCLILFFSSLFALLHPRMLIAFMGTPFILMIYTLTFLKKKTVKINNVVITIFSTIFIISLVFLPEKYLVKKYDPKTSSFAKMHFVFSNHRALKKALNDGNYVYKNYDLNELNKQIETASIKKNIGSYDILNFNIDMMIYELFDLTFIKDSLFLCYQKNLSDKDVRTTKKHISPSVFANKYASIEVAYFNQWTKILITKYPMEIVEKIINQTAHALFDYKPLYFPSFNTEYIQIAFSEYDQDRRYNYLINQLKYEPNKIVVFKYPFVFKKIFLFMGILVKSSLLTLVLLAVFKQKRIKLIDFILIYMYLSSVFTIAGIHSFDVYRYTGSLVPIALFITTISLYRIIVK